MVKIDKARLQDMSTNGVVEWESASAGPSPSNGNSNVDANSSLGAASTSGSYAVNNWLGRGRRGTAGSATAIGAAAANTNSAKDGLLQLGRISSMVMLQRETAEILSPRLAKRISNETLTPNGDAFILLQVI